MAGSDESKLIECMFPVLKVKSLQESLAYYRDVLGFKEDWSVDGLGQVSREGYGIMLDQSAAIHPQEIWIGVHLLEPLHEEFVKSGAVFEQEPQNHPWAYDMKIKDPDGHLLWIGAGSKSDEPFVE